MLYNFTYKLSNNDYYQLQSEILRRQQQAQENACNTDGYNCNIADNTQGSGTQDAIQTIELEKAIDLQALQCLYSMGYLSADSFYQYCNQYSGENQQNNSQAQAPKMSIDSVHAEEQRCRAVIENCDEADTALADEMQERIYQLYDNLDYSDAESIEDVIKIACQKAKKHDGRACALLKTLDAGLTANPTLLFLSGNIDSKKAHQDLMGKAMTCLRIAGVKDSVVNMVKEYNSRILADPTLIGDILDPT